jgi:hypothetical protein
MDPFQITGRERINGESQLPVSLQVWTGILDGGGLPEGPGSYQAIPWNPHHEAAKKIWF